MGIIKRELYSESENLTASTFMILSHPARLKILTCLLVEDHLALHQLTELIGLSQSSVSTQVKRMKGDGLLDSLEAGTTVYYSLNRMRWDAIKWRLELYLEEMNNMS